VFGSTTLKTTSLLGGKMSIVKRGTEEIINSIRFIREGVIYCLYLNGGNAGYHSTLMSEGDKTKSKLFSTMNKELAIKFMNYYVDEVLNVERL